MHADNYGQKKFTDNYNDDWSLHSDFAHLFTINGMLFDTYINYMIDRIRNNYSNNYCEFDIKSVLISLYSQKFVIEQHLS